MYQAAQAVSSQWDDKKTVILDNLISNASTDAQIDQIYSIYKAFRLGFAVCDLGINNQWRAVSVIMGSSSISELEKQRVYNELYELDKTDTKLQ
eukprot:TRINITY_DN63812_c0_g1_i1.p1 TRINITY_DN63812_c0_g1~~TRINITY_DN63812_c0_g1_i1.p1  ORF type:complete len:101 (-),score=21.13 TRINITY_DN63812_c0_g1_i1:16-297(-)